MRKLFLPIALCCFNFLTTIADSGTLRLIFSGDGGFDKALNLEQYNRVFFGEDNITVCSSDNPANMLELPYPFYNRFRIGEDILTKILPVPSEGCVLVYDATGYSLRIIADPEITYAVRVFNLEGIEVLKREIPGGGDLSVETLGTGVYVAVTIGEKEFNEIKFVKQ